MLGLLVDWGYRADGIPVRLFGAWTALPAGPATLAAKTGSRILPIAIHRQPDDRFDVTWGEPIDVASGDPAELQRATQAIADALAATIAAAPDQWYSFKPIWPATADEAADLERRALLMQAGQPDPAGSRLRAPPDTLATGSRRCRPGETMSRLAPAPVAPRAGCSSRPPGSPATCRRPRCVRLAEFAGDLWYRPRPTAPPRPGATCGGSSRPGRRRARQPGPCARPRRTRARSSGSSARPSATPRATTSRSPGRRRSRRGDVDRAHDPRDARGHRRGVRRRAGRSIFVGLHFGVVELPALFLASRVGGAVAPMETIDDPALQAWFVRTRGAVGVRIVGLREARRELLAALRDGTPVGLVGDRDLTGGGRSMPLFGAPATLPLGPAMLAVESGAHALCRGRPADGASAATAGGWSGRRAGRRHRDGSGSRRR